MIRSIDRHHVLYRTTYIKKRVFSGQAALNSKFYFEKPKAHFLTLAMQVTLCKTLMIGEVRPFEEELKA